MPVVFDVLYENHDAEYLDASFLERIIVDPGEIDMPQWFPSAAALPGYISRRDGA